MSTVEAHRPFVHRDGHLPFLALVGRATASRVALAQRRCAGQARCEQAEKSVGLPRGSHVEDGGKKKERLARMCVSKG